MVFTQPEILICLMRYYIFANFGKIKKYFKNEKFELHPHTMGYVCANFRISTILVSEVARGE